MKRCAAAIFILYLCIAALSTVWDRDEARFARATREMVASGNYLYPTFNGHVRPDKPILIYWLMAVPMRLLGATEVPARLASVLGAVAACVCTYGIGRRLFGHAVGLQAMWMLAVSPPMIVEGTMATADAVLLACICGALLVFVNCLEEGMRTWQMAVMALALGAACMTKGPVGIAVPLLAMLTTCWLRRQGRLALRVAVAALGAVALFLCWAVPANAATGGEFLRQGIGHHVLERMTRPLERHGGNFFLYLPYYPVVVLVGFFPWSLRLSRAWSVVQEKTFLLAWIVPTLILMTLVTTKLPHYILPIWPALAILVAASGKPSAAMRRLAVAQLVVLVLLVPAVERVKVSKPLATAIRSAVPDDVPVVTCGYGEPSLIFYLFPRTVTEVAEGQAVTDWLSQPGPGVMVITRDALARAGPRLREMASVRGFNYSTGHRVEVLALCRGAR